MANARKLLSLAALMGAAVGAYNDKFFQTDSRADYERLKRSIDEKDAEQLQKPSQKPVNVPPVQLHDFTVQGVTFKAKSRQDAIKMAVRQGLLPNKKKKRKK